MPTFPVSMTALFSTPPATPPATTAKPTYPVAETSASSEDFCLVDGSESLSTSEFEVYDPPPDTVDNDFAYVPEADGIQANKARMLERALPQRVVSTVDGTVGGVRRAANTIASTPALASKATNAAFSAMKTEFMDSNPFDIGTYNPSRYMATGLAAGAATVVGVAAKTTQGVMDIDYETSINLTDAYLRKGTSCFSREQIATVKLWIADARKGLKDFQKKNYRSLNEAMHAPRPALAGGEKSEGQERHPYTPPPLGSSPGKAVTFNRLIRGAEEVTESMNPDIGTLSELMPELAKTLQALERVRQVPSRVSVTTQKDFYARYQADRCMGSREFIDSLVTRGGILVENATKAPNEQNKRVLVAISGPGTAKTTNIKKLANWVNQPLCMLTGEEFCKVPIPRGKTAYEVFEEWVQTRMMEHFVVDGAQVTNGILLLDDFHFALENDGPFADDLRSREKFFRFLKNLGDANQENVVAPIALAPERLMPLNLVRTQVFITLNRLPKELADGGEEALTSRCIFINVAYPNEEDRRFTAFNHTGNDLKAVVMQHAHWEEAQLEAHADLDALSISLQEIVKLDMSFAKTFDGQLGIRALADLLSRYQQHVMKKLGTQEIVPRDIFSFSGAPPFDPVKMADEIKDYKKGRDENLARIEAKKQVELQVAKLAKATEPLTTVQQEVISGILRKVSGAHLDVQKQLVASAQRRLDQYTNRVALPDAKDFGKGLLAQFGYLKSSGAEGEVDRFGSIANVATELYFKRAAALTTGYRDNKIVRVKFTDPSAVDPSIYSELARILGGVPVHFLMKSDSFLSQESRIKTIQAKDPNYAKAKTLVNTQHIIDLEGEQLYGNFREIIVNEDVYFVASSTARRADGSLCGLVLDTSGIEYVLKNSPRTVSVRTPGVKAIKVQGNFDEGFRCQMAPKLNFFNEVIEKLGDKASASECFVVASMDHAVQRSLHAWRWAQEDTQPDKETIDIFEQYVYAQLNTHEVTLKDGSTFDPRSITLFMLDDPFTNYGANTKPNDITQVMTLGIPPVEGRRARASYTMTQSLEKLKDDADRNLTLFGKAPLEKLTLDLAEQAAFDALVAWDFAQAKRARECEIIIPVSVLEKCVNDLVRRVADRQTDYFGLNETAALPSLKALESEWNEAYKTWLDRVQMVIDIREARKREEDAREKERKREEEFRAKAEEEGRRAGRTPVSKIRRTREANHLDDDWDDTNRPFNKLTITGAAPLAPGFTLSPPRPESVSAINLDPDPLSPEEKDADQARDKTEGQDNATEKDKATSELPSRSTAA